jgi:hypothetical protein
MICVIIRNLQSNGCDITEAHAIGEHPMHDDASLRASATLAFFIPLRLASFTAQLFNAVQTLSGLVNDVGGLVKNRAHPCITDFRDAAISLRDDSLSPQGG